MRLLKALGRQAHHIEKDVAELHGARDVEGLVARHLADAAGKFVDLAAEPLRKGMQAVGIHIHARALHRGEHRHERHLDLLEDVGGILLLERLRERLHRGERHGDRPGRRNGCVVGSALLALRGGQGLSHIGVRDIGIAKIGAHRVEQICRDHGIENALRIH